MKAEMSRSVCAVALSKAEFQWIAQFLYEHTGIALNDSKTALVMGRLDKRLRLHRHRSYSEYIGLLTSSAGLDEQKVAINLLTTNETYFFREPKHFDFLKERALPYFLSQSKVRAWSAASSSGEEAYSVAMLLAESRGMRDWEVLGSDISSYVLEKAKLGLYPLAAADKIPKPLLKKYCLKGCEEYENNLLIEPTLKSRVKFEAINLVQVLPDIGIFDLIFLRNVMIYFNRDTKQKLVRNVMQHLRPGGYFFISHSESLNGLGLSLPQVAPSIYQKPSEQ